MNPEKYEEQDDAQLEAAIRDFRLSIRNWSEREFVRPRAIERTRWSSLRAGFWRTIANPALAGTLAAALLIASVGVPAGIQHQRRVAEQRREALVLQQKQAAEQARKAAAEAVDDEDFLDHVDSDIAQATPDAMQPLASLMNDGPDKSSRR